MPTIKQSCIDEVRARARIEEVVGTYVSLKRAGSQLRGLSPFNQEKTPSFYVHPDKGFYKCFSSGKAGDVFTFVMEIERRSFAEAVETLARRFGVTLEFEDGHGPSAADRSLRQQLYALHDAVAEACRQVFLGPTPEGTFARDYWTRVRRFPASLAEEFRIGFAPADDAALHAAIARHRFPPEVLLASGLFRDRGYSGQPTRAFFRGRLMIPIRDAQDRIVAFTARKTDLTPPQDPTAEAKYINSPETEIFRKSSLLFNLNRARLAAGPTAPFLLVEGQLDALRCWHAGLHTAVAPQGTAITEDQLALLRRYCPKVECFLDGDSAGQKAALRFLPMALKADLEVSFLPLAPGQDPDSFFRDNGAAGLDRLRAGRLSAMQFATNALLPAPASASPQERAHAVESLFDIIAHCDSGVAREGFLRQVTLLLGGFSGGPEALARDFARFLSHRHRPRPARPEPEPAPPAEPSVPDGADTLDEHLLLLFLHFPALQAAFVSAIDPASLDHSHRTGRLLDRALADHQHGLWQDSAAFAHTQEDPADRTRLASLLMREPAASDVADIANRALAALHQRALQPAIADVDRRIATATPGDLALQRQLLAERKALLAKLREPPTVISFS